MDLCHWVATFGERHAQFFRKSCLRMRQVKMIATCLLHSSTTACIERLPKSKREVRSHDHMIHCCHSAALVCSRCLIPQSHVAMHLPAHIGEPLMLCIEWLCYTLSPFNAHPWFVRGLHRLLLITWACYQPWYHAKRTRQCSDAKLVAIVVLHLWPRVSSIHVLSLKAAPSCWLPWTRIISGGLRHTNTTTQWAN